MSRMIFPNLPVDDVAKARDFWTRVGFDFQEDFSNDDAAALVVSDLAWVMLLRKDFFHNFYDTRAHTGTETMIALAAESPAEVDEMHANAVEAGAESIRRPAAEGPMYTGAFRDPDGHIWEIVRMNV